MPRGTARECEGRAESSEWFSEDEAHGLRPNCRWELEKDPAKSVVQDRVAQGEARGNSRGCATWDSTGLEQIWISSAM